ncbi:MAG: NAD-dependent epimerase/dehydratase family protein [Rhodospirillales bacterium]
MKILVTGYKGFIGSHVYNCLIEEGHDVTGYDWDESYGCLPYVRDLDWVIHLGAISSTTEKDVSKVFAHNYDFSIKLYNECCAYGVSMQYASSASVYGDLKSFTEDSDCRPMNAYAWSKYMFDRYVTTIDICDKITCQGFRYFNVYGTNEEHKGDQASVFTKFKNQAIQDGKIKVFENSENYKRDFVCVDDIVQVHKQMLWKKERGVFNVGSGTATSFQKVADLCSKQLGVPIEHIPMPDNLKNQYQEYTKADISKLNNIVDVKWTTPKQWIEANLHAVEDIRKSSYT